MKLSALCRAAEICCPEKLCNIEITQVTCDSRRIRPGGLFVCLPGAKEENGNAYIGNALANGAAAILTQDSQSEDELVCQDTLSAMSRLCRTMYGGGCDKLKLIAVTGTNGKTTVVRLLGSIFSSAGILCGSIGTLGCLSGSNELSVATPNGNANMTTPDPEELFPTLSKMAENGCEYVFLEASSHALARKKLDALTFEAGIYTNLTREHLDFHKTVEAYAEAKARLKDLSKSFIVNADDRNASRFSGAGIITCSATGKADYSARDIVMLGSTGCAYRLSAENYSFGIRSPIPGSFTVTNTLQAAVCALTQHISPSDIFNGIASMRCIPGRMEKVGLSSDADISVFIDYAHTPDALTNVLMTARNMARDGRVVLLFGCGGDRDRGKRREMGAIATKLADFTVITSDNSRTEEPKSIINDILKGIDKEKRYTVIEDRTAAIEYVIGESEPGDIIVIAGKGHEKYEIDKNGRHHFDEASIVRKAWLDK